MVSSRSYCAETHWPAHPQPTRLGFWAGPTMFSRKKRELMKTPSISKKNRAGSPSPQPSGVSEPLRGGGAGGDAPSGWAAGQRPGSNMLVRWRGAQASYSPHQAGLQGPGRTGGDTDVQLMVGALWDGQCHPCPVQGPLKAQELGVECQGGGLLSQGLCRMGSQAV